MWVNKLDEYDSQEQEISNVSACMYNVNERFIWILWEASNDESEKMPQANIEAELAEMFWLSNDKKEALKSA